MRLSDKTRLSQIFGQDEREGVAARRLDFGHNVSRVYNAMLYRPIPRRLYHYTSKEALLGILASKVLFATEIRFLSDSRELRHATDLALRVLGTRLDSGSGERPLLRDLLEMLDGTEAINAYVLSLSENDDRLSQWRGYCRTGPGFAIGFNARSLEALAEAEQFVAAPCEYREDVQHALVSALVDDAEALYEEQVADGTHEASVVAKFQFFTWFVLLAPLLKDPSFAEESEWRFVRIGFGAGKQHVAFRGASAALIPYFRFPLAPENRVGAIIDELIVGPSPMPELAFRAAQMLSQSSAIPIHLVRSSKAPYREI